MIRLIPSLRLFALGILLMPLATISSELDPPKPKLLLGAWIGFDQDILRFCRVELERGGKGVCTVSYVREAPGAVPN